LHTYFYIVIPVRALLLIQPAAFGFNAETAPTNSFQANSGEVSARALEEFKSFTDKLKETGIPLQVFADTALPVKPDAIFPNNWFSTHDDGSIVLYPMHAPNRRKERRPDIIDTLKKRYGYKTLHDLSAFETEGKFLEGTGSIVFDHRERIAYAALSPRTDKDVFLELCGKLNYIPFVFSTKDSGGKPIYHTNVLMALHAKIAVVCLNCIADASERAALKKMLVLSGKIIFEISFAQMESFAGNMLFVAGNEGAGHVILSLAAWNSLDASQQQTLRSFANPVFSDLHTIETSGGGSARCMIAEIY
jgi:hypothetical protein